MSNVTPLKIFKIRKAMKSKVVFVSRISTAQLDKLWALGYKVVIV